MLHDFPRQKLRTLILEYGPAILEDTRRCRALLLDYCSSYPREVNVLIKALEEGIPASLRVLTINSGMALAVPPALRLAQLAQQLVDMWMFEETAARWAVETWALALDVIQPAEVLPQNVENNHQTEEKPVQKIEETHQKKTGISRTRPSPLPNNTRLRRMPENSDLNSLKVIVMIVGILVTCISTGNSFMHTKPTPTWDLQAISTQATAQADILETFLTARNSAPDHTRLKLHPTEGRVNCSDEELTLDLAWELPGEENSDAHYHCEVYADGVEAKDRQRIAETIVTTTATSVTLPCSSYASYRWRVGATNGSGEWSQMGHFMVRCEQNLCHVTAW
ncbi:MAG: hypothetical protein JXA21_15525 [Anaerolineae bacterium]|nr:hypothetical protein [Anaerolineae bacterium]